jgi:hypothetical protein
MVRFCERGIPPSRHPNSNYGFGLGWLIELTRPCLRERQPHDANG